MHCHGIEEGPPGSKGGSGVVLVGNPNVSKSVLFGLLTRRYVTASNYPGTTVEVARGLAPMLLAGHLADDESARDDPNPEVME